MEGMKSNLCPSCRALQEEEERELEEVEDLLEYYLQRAANTQACLNV